MATGKDKSGNEVRKSCVFPFVAGMKIYHNCTYDTVYDIQLMKLINYQNGREKRYWCATEVNELKHVLSWGYCPDECSPQCKSFHVLQE